ncbi:MAG: Peptidyl-prolyl cis-trans isomerase cyp8 [Chrysothrix sp. TS-e1954]|nr:MAG: Peptidyl-prolyl cis-trans isomerase cyp8 [Chrysothrix sp. TS-e1954]
MGKGTDKLYITQSEWSSNDAFSASAGAGVAKSKTADSSTFKRLPFNFCAVSLQPFRVPVCTVEGTIFDHENILSWLKTHGTNPVDGKSLKSSELIKLNFTKNDDGEFVDPVTYKAFTDNSHIVALQNTGNVFGYDTVERLNIKPKNWRDLVSEEEFARKDIITLQDPQNLASRNLSSFRYIQDGTAPQLTREQQLSREDPNANLNVSALGSSAKILRAKEAVAKARAQPNGSLSSKPTPTTTANGTTALSKPSTTSMAPPTQKRSQPPNTAIHTTGRAAASFTSTGLTPHTSGDLALLSTEDYLLKPRRIKQPALLRLSTTHGPLTLELHTEHAPRAAWNFLTLAKRGYYNAVPFHRNIPRFMIQGGDPSGTGRGGESCWGKSKPFKDEWGGSPLTHAERGTVSMANKGKDTNTSQFFVTYRGVKHLDRKHTVFGRVLLDADEGESEETLKRLESVKTEEGDRPVEECAISDVTVFVDPFEEYARAHGLSLDGETLQTLKGAEDVQGDDETTTWTGKTVRKNGAVARLSANGTEGAGKYLDAAALSRDGEMPEEEVAPEWETAEAEPPKKKRKAGGGFGNFEGW